MVVSTIYFVVAYWEYIIFELNPIVAELSYINPVFKIKKINLITIYKNGKVVVSIPDGNGEIKKIYSEIDNNRLTAITDNFTASGITKDNFFKTRMLIDVHELPVVIRISFFAGSKRYYLMLPEKSGWDLFKKEDHSQFFETWHLCYTQLDSIYFEVTGKRIDYNDLKNLKKGPEKQYFIM